MEGSESGVRPTGYASRMFEIVYGSAGPWYDLAARWCLWPLGGERRVRSEIARWCDVRPGQSVVSLCCGTGATERAILETAPDARIVAIDLGRGQLVRARRRDPQQLVDYRCAEASETALPTAGFDRVLIVLALHEMPRGLRKRLLMEARRLCRPGGRIVVVDHGTPSGPGALLLRTLWWGHWIPGNPEVATSREVQGDGLAGELRDCALEIVGRHSGRLGWLQAIVTRQGQEHANWTPAEITRRYSDRGRFEHDRLLLPLDLARRFVRDCRVHGLAVIGVEGFFFGEDGVLATTGMIRDYSGIRATTWDEFRDRATSRAHDFLRQLDPRSGLMVHLAVWSRGEWEDRGPLD